MQENNKTPDNFGVEQVYASQIEAFARNMVRLFDQGTKAFSTLAERSKSNGQGPYSMASEAGEAAKSFGEIARHWVAEPAKLANAQSELFASYVDLWGRSVCRFLGESVEPVVEPEPGDNRFKDPDWSNGQLFDFWKQSYLITSRWAEDLTRNTEGVDERTRKKALFYLNQMLSAMSPSNFPLTNPEVIRTTLATNAENLVQGMTHFVEDLGQSKDLLRISQTDLSAFEIGRNLAVTPGKVVFQNDLIQLIQYSPATAEVYERPLLVVPPWINKYYILDLVPEKSFVRWAVEQGFTVFLVSWVNPDIKLAQKTFEDYMHEGILAAVDAVIHQTGSPNINALGYCVGGTLLASTLAYMAAKGDNRITSASFLAAQVDFSEAGDLLVFIDDAQLNSLEEMMAEQGYLDGSRMAAVFNMLRPRDLIWPYVINNYLLGKKPFPFDLLFWNAEFDQAACRQSRLLFARVLSSEPAQQGRDASRRGAPRSVAGQDPGLRALHQGRPHRAGGVGVSRQQAVRWPRSPCHGGVRPYRRRGQSSGQEEIPVLVGRTSRQSRRVDGHGKGDCGVLVAGLGQLACGLFGAKDPGPRSRVRSVARDRGRARIFREEPKLGASAGLPSAALGKQRQLLEPGRFREAVHQIEILQGLAGRALHQIVDRRDDDGAAFDAVGEHADMTEIRAAHMLRRGDHALLDDAQEGTVGISLCERRAQIRSRRLAGEPHIAGAKLAARHRRKMRREVDGNGSASGQPELLLDLRHVAMIADAVGRKPLARLREQDVLLQRAPGARHAGLGVDDDVVKPRSASPWRAAAAPAAPRSDSSRDRPPAARP